MSLMQSHLTYSYPVDVWDAIQLVVNVPKMQGKSRYAASYRRTMCDIFQWLEQQAEDDAGELRTIIVNVQRADLLAHLKRHCMMAIHSISAASPATQEREDAQGKADAYALIYDLFRDEL